MPIYGYRPSFGSKKMRRKKRERLKTGPRGERRPMSETANAVRVMEIATALTEEEYADGLRREPKPKVRIL